MQPERTLKEWDTDKIRTHRADCLMAIPSGNNMVSTIAMCNWARSYKTIVSPLGSLVMEMWSFDPVDIGRKRQILAEKAVESGAKNLFFLSDDVIVPPNVLIKMLERRRQGARVVTGVYWTKTNPSYPYIFKDYLSSPFWGWDQPDGTIKPWHVGDYFQIDWSGCDCLMIDTEILKELPRPWFSIDYKFNPQDEQGGTGTEDLYFFTKLKQHGIKVWCDTSIQCGHIDRSSGLVFWMPSGCPNAHLGSEVIRKNPLIVADIGAGRRQNDFVYEGAEIVRFDCNPECLPDVVCDVRTIPDLDEKYDVVTAYHILEHIPANDSIKAVQEWTRILKTGGKLIIDVPNIAVPMKAIANGLEDPYAHQMIWGNQANDGEFHYNGFTVEVMRNVVRLAGNLNIAAITLQPCPMPEGEIHVELIKIAHHQTEQLETAWSVPRKGDCACE